MIKHFKNLTYLLIYLKRTRNSLYPLRTDVSYNQKMALSVFLNIFEYHAFPLSNLLRLEFLEGQYRLSRLEFPEDQLRLVGLD